MARGALTDPQRACLAAVRDTRDGGAQLDGIPSYKFGSNDGWLVTSREITAALAVWENTDPKEQQDIEKELPWWNEWIEFLTYNKTRGGFRVY